MSTSIPIGTNEVDAYQDDDLYDDDDDDDEEGFFSAGGDSNNIVALNLTMSLGAIFSPSLGGLLSRFGRKDGRRVRQLFRIITVFVSLKATSPSRCVPVTPSSS